MRDSGLHPFLQPERFRFDELKFIARVRLTRSKVLLFDEPPRQRRAETNDRHGRTSKHANQDDAC